MMFSAAIQNYRCPVMQNVSCQYCGNKAPDVLLELDHIQPVAQDGTNKLLNLITSCFDCNYGINLLDGLENGVFYLLNIAPIKHLKHHLLIFTEVII
jgi:HNH endonuclease